MHVQVSYHGTHFLIMLDKISRLACVSGQKMRIRVRSCAEVRSQFCEQMRGLAQILPTTTGYGQAWQGLGPPVYANRLKDGVFA
jgi:hypothetical protein